MCVSAVVGVIVVVVVVRLREWEMWWKPLVKLGSCLVEVTMWRGSSGVTDITRRAGAEA
jgi:hypothetical protein